MFFNRLALCLVLSFIDAEHGFFDVELVHLLQGVGNVVITLTDLGKVLEHILRRHLEHLPTLLVHQERTNEVVKV